ncbi:nucleoporin Nup186/Nup192/Nup205 [Chytridium lagenaria]|nr:nucleoporin Nup186/Nup192/Nup205 [Chytridium lagenaria]
MSIEAWNTFEELAGLITKALQTTGNPVTKPLELKLSRLRPRFRALLEEEPKSDVKRREIQTGQFTLNGRTENCNAEFIRTALQISDLLNINELKAASLLKHVMMRQDNDRDNLEWAVHEYNRERHFFLECLELLMRGLNSPTMAEGLRNLFSHHLKEIFLNEGSGRSSTIAGKALEGLLGLRGVVMALREDTVVQGLMTGSQLKQEGIGENLIALHAEKTIVTRWYLVSIYFSAMLKGFFGKADVLDLLEVLRDYDTTDNVWIVLLFSVLSGLKPLDLEDLPLRQGGEEEHFEFLKKVGVIVYGLNIRWTSKAFQEVIGVQFAVHVKQLKLHYQQIEQGLGLSEPLDSRLEHGLQSMPFQFVADKMISRNALIDLTHEAKEVDLAFFQPGLLVVQNMFEMFLKRVGRLVRVLKNKSEDTAASRNDQVYQGDPTMTPFESIMYLGTSLYKDRPESALQFWEDPELVKFLKFMTDIYTGDLVRAFFEMLSSLATGRQCAQYAAEFFSSGYKVSWERLFQSFDNTTKSITAEPDRQMNPVEVGVMKAALRFIKQVVKFSSVARTSLVYNPHLQAMNTLFQLLSKRVTTDLKAALFETIAAFCIPTDRNVASDIAPTVWGHLEEAELVQRPQALSSFQYGGAGGAKRQALRVDGIRFDMDQIESQSQTYPETLAFLQLLSTLLVSTKSLVPAPPGADSLTFNSVTPLTTSHYIEFVIDDVFLNINNRLFVSIDERWRMIEFCLQIFDVCIRNFDVTFKESMVLGG